MGDTKKPTGAFSFFAAWMLLHEKADDWLRDAVARARDTPADARRDFQDFLLSADDEKEALKAVFGDAVSTELSRMGFVHRSKLEDAREETDELRRRLEALETMVDRLRER
jgi:polyhydroxyalkanoate synthesis regulator phasin